MHLSSIYFSSIYVPKFCHLETGSHHAVQASLEPVTVRPSHPSECGITVLCRSSLTLAIFQIFLKIVRMAVHT